MATPQPIIEHQVGYVIVSRYEYERGGTFELPPLPGDHLSITLDGANVMARRLDGRRQQGTIHPGDVTVVPRGAASVWTPHIQTPSAVIHLMILPSMWDWAARAANVDPARIQLRDDFATPDSLLHPMSVALLNAAAATEGVPALYADSLTQSLALHMLAHYTTANLSAPPPRAGHRFRAALDYIEAHLDDDITLDDLAATEGLSTYHFARLFKEATGQPPHQYIVTRRVERAQHLLDTTALSLAAVAAQVGFANQSHLTHHFKRIVGVTPGQYRKAVN